METLSLYKKAHLVVAAIRVLTYLNNKPPSVEDVCGLLGTSSEEVYMVCRKLEKKGILEAVEGAYGSRLFVLDHTAMEALSQEAPKSGMEEEIEKFKKTQQERDKKIEEIKAKEEERKRKLFEQLNQGLKQGKPVSE
jgi:DNA-binding MarR family transcriptional regulator